MRNFFFFYLMSVGVSLAFFATYFAILLPQYIDSVFFIIDMILFSSIFILLLANRRGMNRHRNIFMLSLLFFILYLGLSILDNLFASAAPKIIFSTFLTFFMMTSLILSAALAIYLTSSNWLSKSEHLLYLFSPLLLYSIASIVGSAMNADISSLLDLIVISFSIFYLTAYAFKSYDILKHLIPSRRKHFLIFSGIGLFNISLFMREVRVLYEFSSMVSLLGTFVLCFGLIEESDLNLHNYILNSMISHLKQKQRGKFVKYLKNIISKSNGLLASFDKGKVRLIDNPDIPNIEEKRMYNKVLLRSYRWYRRNVKSSARFLDKLKNDYNAQVFLITKLSEMLY